MAEHKSGSSTVRRVLRNSLAIWTGNILNQIAGFILILFISRYLKPEGLGTYSVILSTYFIFESISFAGLEAFIAREVGRTPKSAASILMAACSITLPLALLLYILATGLTATLGFSHTVRDGVSVAGLALFPAGFIMAVEATLLGLERMELVAGMNFLRKLLVVGVSFIALASLPANMAIPALMVIFAASYYLAALIYPFVMWKLIRPATIHPPSGDVRSLTRGVRVFAGISILAAVFWRADQLLLDRLSGTADVGLYSAVNRLALLLFLIPEGFMGAVYPNISRRFVTDPASFSKMLGRSLRYLMIIAFPLACGGAILSEKIVFLLYDSDYAQSVAVFTILAWVLIPYFANSVFYRALLASHHQLISLRILLVNVLVLFGLSYLLVPTYHAVGTAIALLTALTLAFIQNYWANHDFVYKPQMWRYLPRLLLASAAMCLAIYPLREMNLFIPLGVGVVVYVLMVMLLKLIDSDDLGMFKDLWRDRKAAGSTTG
jgi:O-antigen/teichoic acid export membrane protein